MKRIVVVVAVLFGSFLLQSLRVVAGPLAQFRTPAGEIDVELYDKDKPITVQNFIRYVQTGRYTTNMFIHRWEPNFVIQGGGRYVADFTALPPANFPEIVSFPPIANEFNVGIHYSNVFGTIAMAKTSDPNSATSEWFFNLADNSVPGGLDEVTNSGGFTVFGHVVSGTNVLNRFNYTTGAGGVFYTGYGDLVSIPVLLSSVSQQPTLYNLVFVDITLLNVQIANKNGLSQISWNSVSNQANVVEYTTTFPPAWQTVTSLVGNGSATSVVDPTSANANRFYRVRVVY